MTPTSSGFRRKAPYGLSLNAAQVVLLSFGLFILFGTILLSQPFAHAGGRPHALIDDLFTAASAVCVSGLTTIDIGSQYSVPGQLIIMLLMQIGGLGYMTLFTVSMVLIGKRISMRDRLNIQEATDQPGMTGLIGYLLNALRLTLVVEGIGTALIATSTVPEFGWVKGVYLAMFHAISAFNNAGLSLFTSGAGHWLHESFVLIVLSLLVIIGGLGYNVNMELVRRYLLRRRPQARWNTLLKLVLGMSAVLLALGTVVIWFYESRNPATLAGLPVQTQLTNSFFMSTISRTAGFSSLDVAAMSRPSLLIILLLMFVGGGPGGTAGGIKLTTVAVLLAAVYAAIRGTTDVNLFNFKRRVNERIVHKAIAVLVLSALLITAGTFVLASLESFGFLEVLFEAVSAFGAAGLSMNITPQLSTASKLVVVFLMYAGRVGVLFIMLAVFPSRRKSALHYAEEPLLIG